MESKSRIALLSIVTILLLGFFAVNAQCLSFFGGEKGNGKVVKDDRHLTDFQKIKVSTGIDVFITQSDSEKVVVEVDENLLPLIVTEVKDGTLIIYHEKSIKNPTKLRVNVSVKVLNEIKASSGSDVVCENELKADKLDIDLSSGSGMKLKVNANELTCEISSGADSRFEGKSKSFSVNASSGSNLKAFDLVTENCTVETSSGSDIEVNVTGTLKAHASSGSDVEYKGNPQKVEVRTSSGGDVNAK